MANREQFLFVVGFANDGQGGSVVRPADAPAFAAGVHLNLRPDMTLPLTRARCVALLQVARDMTGRDLYRIEIRDSEYSKTPGNEYADFPETCYRDNTYVYDRRADSLTILEKGHAVYINDAGHILRGDDAAVSHADSLDV